MLNPGFINIVIFIALMSKFITYLKILLNQTRYIRLQKLLNLVLVIVSYIASILFRRAFIRTSPLFMSVEPADFCQLSCPQCPVGRSHRHKGDYLNYELYQSLIKQVKKNTFHLIFYFQGEPTLNRNLPEMIRLAHNAGIYTSTSTNGQAITPNMAQAIVQSGLDKIIFSIDGTTQNVYQNYRSGGNLQKIIDAVTAINDYKKELNSFTPVVELQFIVFKTNEHQMGEMKKLAVQLGANLLKFKSAQIYDVENIGNLASSDPKFSRYKQNKNGTYSIKYKQPNHCFRLWSGGVVNTKGDLLPCCFDKNSSYSYGNLYNESLKSIYNNGKSMIFRSSILKDRSQHEMCRNCTSQH